MAIAIGNGPRRPCARSGRRILDIRADVAAADCHPPFGLQNTSHCCIRAAAGYDRPGRHPDSAEAGSYCCNCFDFPVHPAAFRLLPCTSQAAAAAAVDYEPIDN